MAHGVLTGVLGLLAAGLAVWGRGAASPDQARPAIRFVFRDFLPSEWVWVDLADDGTLAYSAEGAIWVRPPGALEANPLVEAEASEFSFSPDGREIVFTPDDPPHELRKVPVEGGPVQNLWAGDGTLGGMPVWGADGWIYFGAGEGYRERLLRIPETGGAAELLLEVRGADLVANVVTPGGRALLYTQSTAEDRVMLLDLATRDTTELVANGRQARLTPTGHLVYARREGTLWARPFDLFGLRLTGPPVLILDGLYLGSLSANYVLSESGTLAYLTGTGRPSVSFVLVDAEGTRERLPIEPSDHYDIQISPDGAFASYTREDDIWIFDLDTGNQFQLTEDRSGQHNPVWSPDGDRVAYTSTDGIRVRPVDGSSEAETLTGTSELGAPEQWLDDGTLLHSDLRELDIAATFPDGGGAPRMLLEANWAESHPSVSPDGRWLAYLSGRAGPLQLYVRGWPGLEGETQVSGGNAEVSYNTYPQWSPDSGTLYYLEEDRLVAAELRPGADGGIVVVDRRTLPVQVNGGLRAAHPDGRLVLAEVETPEAGNEASEGPRRLVVVTNWFEQLRERMGGG